MKTFLPIFILSFMLLFLVWNYSFRKRLNQGKEFDLAAIIKNNQFFQVMLALAAFIIGLYCFNPEYYSFLIPIDALDVPFINETGLFIMRLAFFWLVSSMIHSYLLFQAIQRETKRKAWVIFVYAQKLALVSVSLLLLGLAVTISSVAAILLCLIGLGYYFNIVLKRSRDNI